MDTDTKLFLGRILGEVYRIQEHTEGMTCNATQAQIYGLLNGSETIIDGILRETPLLEDAKFKSVIDVLNEYFSGEEKDLKGYYSIEGDLNARNVSRSEAIVILTILKSRGQFTDEISKIEKGHSPMECSSFDIDEDTYS